MSYYTKITKAGLAAITAAMNNNSKVPITYMAFGDGNGYIPEPDENATSLVNEVYRVGVNKVEVHSKNPNWLVCEAIIPSAVGGFNIREVALYDSTGNTMLAIASYPPTYKPTVEEGAAKIQTIRIVIQVDNSGNFELIVDPDVVLATVADINEFKNKQEILNKNIIRQWVNKEDGYLLDQRVLLENGEIVRCTINNNRNNPNEDLTGWMSDLAHINFSMFKADSTGEIACDAEIIKAFNASKHQKRKLVNHKGVYLLNGSQEIEISFDYDLTGTIFKLGPNFSGGFKITRNATTTVHTYGDVLNKFKSLGVVAAGESNFNGLSSVDGFDNQYVKFLCNQPMFSYNGTISNRFELNRILKRGQLLGSFMFDFDCSKIKSVTLQPVSETVLTGTGLTIDETSLSGNVTIVTIDDGNSFDLKNFKFIDNAFAVAANTKDKIKIGLNAHDVRIDYVDTSAVYINNVNASNYTITMWENFGVELNHICSDGYGWGATGSNNCRRVSIKNSQLSRVDFHKPFHEWLNIEDSVIGNWGILCTALGDLTLTNIKFNMRQAYVNNGFIRSREDASGFCNGKLTMNNVTIEGDLQAGSYSLLHCQRSTANALPVGSPVRPEFWTDVEINGLTIRGRNLNTLISSNQGANLALKMPQSISMKHVYLDDTTNLNINVGHFAVREEGVRFVLDDAKIYNLLFLSGAVATKLDVSMSKLRGVGTRNHVFIDNTADGVFNLHDCNVVKYREYSGGWSVFSPIVNFIGGELNNRTDAVYFDCQGKARDRIKLLGTRLNFGDVSAMKSDLHFFSAKNCTWNNLDYFPFYEGEGTENTKTFTMPISEDITLIVKNSTGKVDQITIDTRYNASILLPNLQGNVTTTINDTNVSIKVDAANLFFIGLVSS